MNKRNLPLLLSLALAFTCRAAAAPAQSLPASDFLYAIRQVETGNHYDAPTGRHGELGAYQFRREVWYQHTRAPFYEARTAEYADEIALRHYQWIADQLHSAGLPASAWNLAAAWNSGVSAVSSGHIPRTTRDYANRVNNLVREEVSVRKALTPHFAIMVASDVPVIGIGQ